MTPEWEPQEPPADFVDRVMENVAREIAPKAAPRRRTSLRLAVASSLTAAAAVAVLVPSLAGSGSGEVTASGRQEIRVGSRGIAVLEPGAHLAWAGDHVTQTSGDVFYRVEGDRLGRSFRVSTPQGEVEVRGTCFRVRLEKVEEPVNKRDWKLGVGGAAVGVAAVVSVYEGKVTLSHAAERVTLTAGESARADGAGVAPGSGSADAAGGDPLLAANANLADAVRDAKRRLEAIEAQKALVEKRLAEAQARLAAGNTHATPVRDAYDLSQDDWKELARKGQVKARFPCPDAESWQPSTDALAALGLAPGDAAAIREAMQQSADRIWASVRPLCIQALDGNAKVADKLGPSVCQRFVLTMADERPDDTNAQMRKVAEIRAGIAREPSDPGELGAFGQMLYTLSGESKVIEHQLAQSFGPESAHRILFGPEGVAIDSCSLSFVQTPRPLP